MACEYGPRRGTLGVSMTVRVVDTVRWVGRLASFARDDDVDPPIGYCQNMHYNVSDALLWNDRPDFVSAAIRGEH